MKVHDQLDSVHSELASIDQSLRRIADSLERLAGLSTLVARPIATLFLRKGARG